MAIKIIDKLKPATNKFKIADASDISFSETQNVGEIIATIDGRVSELNTLINEAPSISYSYIGDKSIIKSFNTIGEDIKLYFNIESRKPGQCNVVIEKKNSIDVDESGNVIYPPTGVFSPFKRQSINPGMNIEILLGSVADFSIGTYRISVTDNTGNLGKYKESGIVTDSPYMYFFVRSGEINLNHFFELGNKTYSENSEGVVSVEIPYQLNTGSMVGDKVLYYKVSCNYNGNIYESTLKSFKIDNTSGVGNFNFSLIKDEEGNPIYTNYDISIYAKINNNDLYLSNTVMVTIPVLKANSSSLVINTPLKSQISTNDELSVSITPTTSSIGAQGANALIATFILKCAGSLGYRNTDNISEEIKYITLNNDYILSNFSSNVTHGQLFSQFLGKVQMPLASKIIEDDLSFSDITGEFDSNSQIVSCDCTLYISIAPTNIQAFPNHSKGELEATFSLYLYSGEQAFPLSEQNIHFNIDSPDNIDYEGLKWISTHRDPIINLLDMNALSGIFTETTPYEDSMSYFKFASGTYGVANFESEDIKNQYYSPSYTQGFSIELMARCHTLGEIDEVGFYLETSLATFKLSPGKAIAQFKGIKMEANTSLNEFSHVVFVYDPVSNEISNARPYSTLRIYVNGILTKIEKVTSEDNLSLGTINSLILGAQYDSNKKLIINNCNIDISMLRIYGNALTSDDVISNYKSCLKVNHKNEVDRRESSGLMEIYFIKRRGIENILDKKNTINTRFSLMNSIEIKNGTPMQPGSKNAYVNCAMYCKYLDKRTLEQKWIKYDDVDVWLQGTSSLKYPVKNYQIKLWKDREVKDENGNIIPGQYTTGSKYKITPPGKGIEDGWHPNAQDYVFTLKCDYMEQSHRNNTPTACYYEDKVLDNVINYINENYPATKPAANKDILYSPAKRIQDNDKNRLYRDAINGFPCKVYYSDNTDAETDLNDSWDQNSEIYTPSTTETLAGTYMFNVDKEGKQLGFDIKVKDAVNNRFIIEEAPKQISIESDMVQRLGLIEGFNCTKIDNSTYQYYVYTNSNGKIAPITFNIDEEGKTNYIFNVKYGEKEDGTPLFVKTDSLPCISYEGATNNNSSAAAFYPISKIDMTKAYEAYINNIFENYKDMFLNFKTTTEINGQTYYAYNIYCYDILDKYNNEYYFKNNIDDINNDNLYIVEEDNIQVETPIKVKFIIDEISNIYKLYINDEVYTKGNSIKLKIQLNNGVTTGSYMSPLVEIANVCGAYDKFLDYFSNKETPSTEYIFDALAGTDLQGKPTYLDYHIPPIQNKKSYINNDDPDKEYDYIASTLEPRHTYSEDWEDESFFNTLTYDTIKNTINWVYNASEPILNPKNPQVQGFDENTFKNEFERYFSYEYCLTYYLQMMLFAQVDNAGKNAMFDTWGDGKLYPRPYDMDTQMGLDNSGQDNIPSSAELHWDLSPSEISIFDTSITGSVNNWVTSTSEHHPRYKRYNTYESRLWKTFGKVFANDIRECYKYLRMNNVYNEDSICKYMDSMTSDVISEKLYNSDVVSKYLSYKTSGDYSSNYLYVTQGNRQERYREFLKQRLAFLDTVFKYNESPTNASMLFRCNSKNVSNIGIEVTTPQYIQFTVDSGAQAIITAFVSPEDKFTLSGQEYNGVLFSIPTTGGDKNIFIYGVGSVRQIHFLKDLKPTYIELGQARSLTKLDLTGASLLSNIYFGDNIYLKEINLQDLLSLEDNIDLSKCSNLQYFNASGSGITGLNLPLNSPISTVNISNTSGIETLQLQGAMKLNITNDSSNSGLKYSGCSSLKNISFIDCPLLESFNFKQFKNLNNLNIQSCDKITSVDLSEGVPNLNTLTLDGCDNLSNINLDKCGGDALKKLNFSGLPNLNKLSMCSTSTPDGNIGVLFLPESKNDVKWETLNLYDTCIRGLSTKGDILEDASPDDMKNTYNFEGINFKGNALKLYGGENIHRNIAVKYIDNLNYTGNLTSLFSNMINLISISNLNLTPTGDNINSMFYNCGKLKQITLSNDSPQWDNISSATSLFNGCNNIYLDSVKNILDKMPNVQNLSSFLSSAYNSALTNIGEEEIREHYSSTLPNNFFSNNKSIQKLSSAFYSTRFNIVEPGLFDNLNDSLTDISGIFQNCSRLTYIPHNLFQGLKGLTSIKCILYGCQSLGEIKGYSLSEDIEETPCIFSNSFENVFSESNEISNAMGAFCNCKQVFPDDQDEKCNVKHLFDQLPNLKYANGMFALCGKDDGKGIKYIPENLFEKNPQIFNIDGIFMNAGLKGDLPSSLSSNSLGNLKYARGAFCDNQYLTGNVSNSFLRNCPNLISIGSTGCGNIYNTETKNFDHLNYVSNTTCINTPGIFANTSITSMDYDALQGLSQLENCSLMFYQGTQGGFINRNNAPAKKYTFKNISDSNRKEFKINIPNPDNSEENKLVDYLPIDLFTGCSKLKNLAGMFAFRKGLKGILNINGANFDSTKIPEYSQNDNGLFDPIYTIDEEGNKITNIVENTMGMFAGCSDFDYVNLSKLFKGQSNLINISIMFADTSLNYDFNINKTTI